MPPPSKSAEKRRADDTTAYSSTYRVSALDSTGTWISVASVFPRVEPVGQAIEMGDYVVKGRVTMKIEYDDKIKLDHLPFYSFKTVDLAPRPLRIAAAVHSKTGDIATLTSGSRGLDVVVKQGEYIDLTLQGSPPAAGTKQLLLIATQGKFESAGQFKAHARKISFDRNYHNPINPNTTFSFYLPEGQRVKLELFNVLGQKVITLVDGERAAGQQAVVWDGRDSRGQAVASGIYFARFTAGDFTATRKVEVLK